MSLKTFRCVFGAASSLMLSSARSRSWDSSPVRTCDSVSWWRWSRPQAGAGCSLDGEGRPAPSVECAWLRSLPHGKGSLGSCACDPQAALRIPHALGVEAVEVWHTGAKHPAEIVAVEVARPPPAPHIQPAVVIGLATQPLPSGHQTPGDVAAVVVVGDVRCADRDATVRATPPTVRARRRSRPWWSPTQPPLRVGGVLEAALVVAILSARAGDERAPVAVGFGEGDAAVGVFDDVERATVGVGPRDVVRVGAGFGVEAVAGGQQRAHRTVHVR